MTILTAPAGTLSDGVIELRMPSVNAGDLVAIERYVEDDQLDGGWLPDVPLVSSQQLLADWLDGWAGRNSRNGAAFVVTVHEAPGFVGVAGMAEGDDAAIRMFSGTAPSWRGRGLASRATRLASQWVARQPGVRTVEAFIDQGQRACERVAVNAGFVMSDTMTQSDPGTGDTVVLRYIMDHLPAG